MEATQRAISTVLAAVRASLKAFTTEAEYMGSIKAVLLGTSFVCVCATQLVAQQSTPSAEDFALASAQTDAYEIVAGRIAIVETQDGRIRDFAQQMTHEHDVMVGSLIAAASKSGLPPLPRVPNVDQQRLLSALQSTKGRDFDISYITQQVVVHRGALAVVTAYASEGGDVNLRQVAQQAIPKIRHHLEIALQLQSAISR